MKRDMLIIYHSWRMAWNWGKCRRLIESTGHSHSLLYYGNYRYFKASLAYQESRDFLVQQGEYVTAKEEIERYQKVSAV